MLSGVAMPSEVEAADDELTLGYVNWACAEGKTYTAKAVLEERLDFDVDTMMADAGPIYQGVADGDIDAFLAVWIPATDPHYVDQLEDEMIKAGVNYLDARVGIVVPEYVDIDSIEEMNEHADKFDNRIIGIDAGAGIMDATQDAIDHYDLDLTLLDGSDAAMTASLMDAIDNEEWVAVTGWVPHWKFGRWDLKFLEDSDKIFGEAENIYSFTRQDLGADHPRVVNFMHDFRMDSEQLGEVMGWIDEGMEPEEAGRRWVEENPEIVDSWLRAADVSE